MSYAKNLAYREIPFASETPQEDFFIYDVVKNLFTICETNKQKILRIRTIALLENEQGRVYIKQINTKHDPSAPPDPKQRIRVSLARMQKSTRASSVPYPVQIFGTLEWKGHPVIFAQIVQALTVSVAVQLNETMQRLTTKYAHRQVDMSWNRIVYSDHEFK